MVGGGGRSLVGVPETFSPEPILGLFETEEFSTVGSSLFQNLIILGGLKVERSSC